MDPLPDRMSGRLAEYAALAEQVRSMREGIRDVRTTAYSEDGLITAVVGGRGELVELELDPRIYRDPDATALASTILDTVRDAAAQAEHEAGRLAEKLLSKGQRVSGHGDDVDPVFDPVLHLLDAERKKDGRPWLRA